MKEIINALEAEAAHCDEMVGMIEYDERTRRAHPKGADEDSTEWDSGYSAGLTSARISTYRITAVRLRARAKALAEETV